MQSIKSSMRNFPLTNNIFGFKKLNYQISPSELIDI